MDSPTTPGGPTTSPVIAPYYDDEAQSEVDLESTDEAAQEGPLDFADDFLHKPVAAVKDFTLFMKIHVILALATVSICFLVWHYTSSNPATSFWWWIYPFFFFILTLTSHFYYQTEEIMRGVVVAAIEINLMFFFIDGITSAGPPTWFIFPWTATAVIGCFIYYLKFKPEEPKLTMFFYQHLILNVMFFLVWLQGPRVFPWFFLTLLGPSIPLSIMYMRTVYKEYRAWLYTIVALIYMDLIVFLIWGFTDPAFPWFGLVWFASGGVAVLLYYKFHQKVEYDDLKRPQNQPGSFSDTYPVESGSQGYNNV